MSPHKRRGIEQRHALAKRVILGPIAPAALKWSLAGTPTRRKADILRGIVVPPIAASAKDYVREVPPGFLYAGNTKDLLGLMVYLFGVWEPNLSTFLQSRLRPGDTFIDVGANSGWFTAMGARLVGPDGKVVAVEASPQIARLLYANLERNGFENTRVIEAAVMSGPGLVDIVPGPDENIGMTSVSATHTPAAVQVRGDALPALLSVDEMAAARVVKIDVEGAEYEVVAGLRGSLERFADSCEFVVEVGPGRADDPADVEALMATFAAAGYTPYLLPNHYDPRSYMLEAVPTALEKVTGRPREQIDVVFSRQGGQTLPM